jgi:hypothetical protein
MNPAEQTPAYLLALPFRPQRSWLLPDGTTPERQTAAEKVNQLAE